MGKDDMIGVKAKEEGSKGWKMLTLTMTLWHRPFHLKTGLPVTSDSNLHFCLSTESAGRDSSMCRKDTQTEHNLQQNLFVAEQDIKIALILHPCNTDHQCIGDCCEIEWSHPIDCCRKGMGATDQIIKVKKSMNCERLNVL